MAASLPAMRSHQRTGGFEKSLANCDSKFAAAMENILPVLVADAPDALTELCGVNLLERLLRILQRLGFRRAIVFSSTPEIIGPELAKPSWARQKIKLQLVATAAKPVRAPLVLR